MGDFVHHIGFIAAILTTAAFVPQVVKTHRSKHTKDISLTMYIVFCIGVGLWTIYGLVLGLIPVVLANSATLALSLYVLIMKIRFG